MRPSDDDALGTDFQVVQRILSRVGVLDPLVRDERVSPWLTGLGPRSMKQQVELFDCAVFLDKFQELVPVDKKRVSLFISLD